MVELLFGLYLIAVGLTGNAGGLIAELETDGAFVPFAVALSIFYYAWGNAPPKERGAVRALIIGLAAAVVISQNQRIISGLRSAWSALTSLSTSGSGGITNSGVMGAILGGVNSGSGSSTPTSKTAFLSSIFPQAQAVANNLGVPVSGVLAQTALETGWGTSHAYMTLNNPAGINVAGAATGTNYAGYSSVDGGLTALQNLVTTQYPAAVGQTSVVGYANALQNGGYATDPAYANKIIGLANGPTIQNFLANNAP